MVARRTPILRTAAGKLHLLDFASNAAGKIRLDVHLAFIESRSEASGHAHAPRSHLDKSDYKKGSPPAKIQKSEISIVDRGASANRRRSSIAAATHYK